ncbi:hypothetical protein EYY60_01130 [Flavobacterium zhairuonense]|uniref:hypothetical protein n=1 Tax=Flavobacterium zhairuonense TaxID=2493631 RepID=UPI00104BD857|nr:hypothetical protein [Flavobacterium zhairuonense]KAF2516808.1 hypothetical protein EYY60_01130 [Flavobacterium zhairuonense]
MKLTYEKKTDGDYYFVNNPKLFNGISIGKTDIEKVLNFAYSMCFGEGHHRSTRTGGQNSRKNGEKFCNTFQGKLAELVLYNHFKANSIECNEPDFGIYKEGIWDDSDLEIQNKKLNIKSAASQSNLLLLETKDWTSEGKYIPNLVNGATNTYDYFILVRINPDVKKLFRSKSLMYTNQIPKTVIEELIFSLFWTYDIAGYCSNEDLKMAIANKNILPQNSLLNKYTKMDAENYYIQSGNMSSIEKLISIFINNSQTQN